MQQRDPRLMTPRETVSELASILASGYLRHVKARRFMDEGGPLPLEVAQPEESQEITENRLDSSGHRSLHGETEGWRLEAGGLAPQ